MKIEKYDNIKPPEKIYERNTNGKILYIRHGKTEFNILQQKFGSENVKTLGKYTDGILNDEGKEQAKSAQKIINNFKIEKVYCSPMRRTLETCLLIFENHPERNNIIVEVCPYITELVNCAYDIPKYIEDNKKEYNLNSKIKFDWSNFDKHFKSNDEENFFYLNFIDTLNKEEIETQFNNLVEARKKRKMSDEVSNLTIYAKEKNIKTLESFKHLFYRTLYFKKLLENNHKDSLLDNQKKIIVVTHKAFINFSTSKLAYNMKIIEKNPEDCCVTNNCEFVSLYLN